MRKNAESLAKGIIGNPDEFIGRLTVMNKEKQRLTRLRLNEAQEKLIGVLKEHDRVIVLKARHLGVSTLCRAWHFWNAYTALHPQTFAVVSHTRQSAEDLHRMEKTFYQNLPAPLRKPLQKASAKTLKFKDTGANVRVFTAGGKGGTRSFSMSSAHLSEFAFYDDQKEVMATVSASVGEGQIVIESTPNAYGDYFHDLVLQAESGDSEWKLVFFPWFIHSLYSSSIPAAMKLTREEEKLKKEHGLDNGQIAWRRKQVRTLGIDKFQREYPATIDECFQSAVPFFFDHEKLDEIERVNLGSHEHRLYADPVEGDKYVLGCDVGAGIGEHFSAFTVVSYSTRQPVYHYISNQIPPAKLAEKILDLAKRYNNARVIVEANNHGHLVLHRLREFRTKNLYQEDGHDFFTTNKTRPLLWSALREALEDGVVEYLDTHVLDELKAIIYKRGKPQAPRRGSDDVTMSMGLCYYVLSGEPLAVTRGVRSSMLDEHIARMKSKRAKRTLPWSVTGGDTVGGY